MILFFMLTLQVHPSSSSKLKGKNQANNAYVKQENLLRPSQELGVKASHQLMFIGLNQTN